MTWNLQKQLIVLYVFAIFSRIQPYCTFHGPFRLSVYPWIRKVPGTARIPVDPWKPFRGSEQFQGHPEYPQNTHECFSFFLGFVGFCLQFYVNYLLD